MLGSFNKHIAGRVLEHLDDQLWSGGAIGDDAVGVYAAAVGDVAVGKAREAVVPHDAGPSVRSSELSDHAHGK